MNQELVNKDLTEHKAGESKLQSYLRERFRGYLKASCDAMSIYHSRWDENDDIYRAYRKLDKEDEMESAKKKPVKLVVPISYAQAQTFLSFVYGTYTQRDYFFELRGRGPEDQTYRHGMELDLQYQLERQQWPFKLYNFVLDAVKYGFFAGKVQWGVEKDKVRSWEEVPSPLSMFAKMLGQTPTMEKRDVIREVTSYEGCQISCVSPYNFYPDPSFPVAKFQQGEFVANEEEVSLNHLKKNEGSLYYGTEFVKSEIATSDWNYRKNRRVGSSYSNDTSLSHDLKGNAILAEIIFESSDKELSEKSGLKLGDDPSTKRYIACMANDDKIIRLEEYTYFHGKYGYFVGEYSPDHNSFLNPGLTDTIYELQNTISWFINSHIVNVKKVLANRFIGDPNRIHWEDIEREALFIRTKSGASDVDRVIKQIQVTDVTSSHVKDAETLHKIVQLVTGINDNALGQYAQGRRSATEARSVSAGAAARLKMHAQLLYSQGFEHLGTMMIANTRQGRSQEIYSHILGDSISKYPYEQVILSDPARVAGGYDFIPYDATLPTEKMAQANVLKELFSVLISNPNTIQLLNKNPLLLLDHLGELLGMKNLKDFNLTNAPLAPQAQVMPDQQALDVAGEQGMEGVDMTGENILRQLATA